MCIRNVFGIQTKQQINASKAKAHVTIAIAVSVGFLFLATGNVRLSSGWQ